MIKSFILGLIASFFFSFTFILNRQMNLSGGSWIWSSSLRYIFMFFILLIIMIMKKQLVDVLKDIIKRPIKWFLWSTIGFGLFYAPLCFASDYGASWLVAGTWQITIIAGALMSPLFSQTIEENGEIIKIKNKLPIKTLLLSTIILIGIFLMQFEEAYKISFAQTLLGIIPVIIAAFAYPLGNRKMMEVCHNKFTTFQRVFGMTLCSMPFWIILSGYGLVKIGPPSKNQMIQALLVAIFSGIIATILFFKATDLVSNDLNKLAVIESTQAGEVVFTVICGILLFNDKIPSTISLLGLALVILGMILNSFIKS